MSAAPVPVGARFGRLEVRSRADAGRWLCRCECGVWRKVRIYKLRAEQVRSCGCLRRELSRARCIAKVPALRDGQRFGRWRVLERASPASGGGVSRWRCRCECGREKPVRQRSLLEGRSRGCASCSRRVRA